MASQEKGIVIWVRSEDSTDTIGFYLEDGVTYQERRIKGHFFSILSYYEISLDGHLLVPDAEGNIKIPPEVLATASDRTTPAIITASKFVFLSTGFFKKVQSKAVPRAPLSLQPWF